VEVCDQGIDHFEMIARIDKDFCPSASGFQNSIFSCCRFQCSAACGSYCYYTFTCLLCVIDQLCLILLYYVEFGMHMVAFHVIYFDRAESSETYMKSHMSDIDAFFLYFFKKLFSKVQSCCRCCCGAFVLCINCLITVLIFQFMCNIRRQRHFAKLIQDFLKDSFIMELDQTVSLVHHINNLTF